MWLAKLGAELQKLEQSSLKHALNNSFWNPAWVGKEVRKKKLIKSVYMMELQCVKFLLHSKLYVIFVFSSSFYYVSRHNVYVVMKEKLCN